jgi:hypothetical protein
VQPVGIGWSTVSFRLAGSDFDLAIDGHRLLIGPSPWGRIGFVRLALRNPRDAPFGPFRGLELGVPSQRLRRDEQEEEWHGDEILREPIQAQPFADSTSHAGPWRKQTTSNPPSPRFSRSLGFSTSRGIDTAFPGPEEWPVVLPTNFSLSLHRLRCSAELEYADRCRKPVPSGDLVANRLES